MTDLSECGYKLKFDIKNGWSTMYSIDSGGAPPWLNRYLKSLKPYSLFNVFCILEPLKYWTKITQIENGT